MCVTDLRQLKLVPFKKYFQGVWSAKIFIISGGRGFIKVLWHKYFLGAHFIQNFNLMTFFLLELIFININISIYQIIEILYLKKKKNVKSIQ